MVDFLKTYRQALFFLAVFLGLYLLLNTLYGFYIEAYYPMADPLTILVSQQVGTLLSWFYEDISLQVLPGLAYGTLQYKGIEVINVFEGCNGVNVMIVYLAFLFAFSGRLKSTLFFLFTGLALLYLVNLVRVFLLFQISLHFPQQLYFFHKYFFTGILYLFVFTLWFAWVKRVKKEKLTAHAA